MIRKYSPAERVRMQIINPVTNESKSITYYGISVKEMMALIEGMMEKIR